ncbi:hypothetical protein [Nostoc sp.]|uniref:hypothetical protein n=1 Tax=Nostoc sp. TaxID=1180 RepID=UPI0035940918
MSIAFDNNLLWVPPNIGDLLTVSVDGQADETTVQGMHVINNAASLWLSGAMDDYTYFELLDHYSIDPKIFVGEVEEHVQLLMK